MQLPAVRTTATGTLAQMPPVNMASPSLLPVLLRWSPWLLSGTKGLCLRSERLARARGAGLNLHVQAA
eukprot:9905462-Alexandrium_andersonii.AAC.1